MKEFQIPSVYQDGYDRASAQNPALAMSYIRNTVVDDPLADAVVEALASLDARDINRFMNACMEPDVEPLPDTPQALRDFFEPFKTPPEWFDRDAVLPGRYAFYQHLDLFIIGFIVVSLRNFNSLMSKVFFMTGQATTLQGLQVIRQNIRYLTETLMLPGALDCGERGWKFSLRIRLTHARIRRRLRMSGQWDEAVFGAPISAANMALTSANFSASLIRDVEQLGANLDAESRSGLMQIWRYASWLIGTPEELLCDGKENETAELSRVGHLCEPIPDTISVVITNATVNALPEVVKLTDPAAKQELVNHAYRVARSLLGNELANQFGFPRQRTMGMLPWMRCKYRLQKSLADLAPGVARLVRDDPFVLLLDAAMIDNLRHRMPEELETTKKSTASARRRGQDNSHEL